MKKVLLVLFCTLALAVVIITPKIHRATSIAVLDEEEAVSVQQTAAVTAEPSPSPTAVPIITPEPLPTSDPTPPPTTTLSIAAVGDIMCLYGQLTNARQGGEYVFSQCFEQISPVISEADIAIGNLETLVAESYPYTGSNEYEEKTITPDDGSAPYTTSVRVGGSPKINAPESFLSAVIGCGFDALVTANNHAFDRKAQGIAETLAKLDEYGIYHTGSYTLPEDRVPLIIDKNGIKIGVVSYTDISNQKPGSSEAYMLNRYNEDELTADIEAAKQAGAEFVIVYIHWGEENTHGVTSRQRKMAQFIADAGADIILGSHAHCTQPFDTVETERGPVPVIYSMGNFISSMGRTINKDSVIVNILLEKNYLKGTLVIKELTYTPTYCTATDAGSYIVLPTTSEYIGTSEYASSLEASRSRTIDVLGETAAVPE